MISSYLCSDCLSVFLPQLIFIKHPRSLLRGCFIDAGIGKDNAGIRGLDYLDQINLASATADAQTCHIGNGDHMLEHGIISHVNRSAAALGCTPGQSVRDCAELMRSATVPKSVPPSITEGAGFVMRDVPGEPTLICADSIGMLQPDDAGRIVITASHAALSDGRPDNVVPLRIHAIFFSDAGGGMDGAGIARLADLDQKAIIAGTTSAESAPIGDSRAIYRDGILSHVNKAAARAGGPGQHAPKGLYRPAGRRSKNTNPHSIKLSRLLSGSCGGDFRQKAERPRGPLCRWD